MMRKIELIIKRPAHVSKLFWIRRSLTANAVFIIRYPFSIPLYFSVCCDLSSRTNATRRATTTKIAYSPNVVLQRLQAPGCDSGFVIVKDEKNARYHDLEEGQESGTGKEQQGKGGPYLLVYRGAASGQQTWPSSCCSQSSEAQQEGPYLGVACRPWLTV